MIKCSSPYLQFLIGQKGRLAPAIVLEKGTEKPKVGRKRKVLNGTNASGECIWCKVKKTAQWRKGPKGARSLCNACGLEWAKQIRTEALRMDCSNLIAEENLIANYKDRSI
jgi:hypothetical protein